MADLIGLSTKIVDSGRADEPVNRVSGELSEIAPGLAMVESFSHVVTWDSGDGLVCFDTSHVNTGQQVVDSIRQWSSSPFNALVYTHGHADHVGGSAAFAANSVSLGHNAPRVIGHKNVQQRFDRYRYTDGWNRLINARQFGGISGDLDSVMNDLRPAPGSVRQSRFIPDDTLNTTDVVDNFASMTFGDSTVEFHHGRGETDDHLWSWFPKQKWVATGDFVIWNFPNAGNPQKVQRWPLEWAQALRAISAKEPELLLPAHGLPIAGKERIARVLDDIAGALEYLVANVVEMMNAGESLDTIVHSVRIPAQTLGKPYLRPLYDEPEFVVRNIWRQYGGWWDAAPSRLKPAPDADLANEIATLAGGSDVLIKRARDLADAGDIRLACHLADFAGWASKNDPDIHRSRAEIYEMRRKQEMSLMAKGIFKSAVRESESIVKAALGE